MQQNQSSVVEQAGLCLHHFGNPVIMFSDDQAHVDKILDILVNS